MALPFDPAPILLSALNTVLGGIRGMNWKTSVRNVRTGLRASCYQKGTKFCILMESPGLHLPPLHDPLNE
jgi:hypothetical protein